MQEPEPPEVHTPGSAVTHASNEHVLLSEITTYENETASEWSSDGVTGQSMPLAEEPHVVVCGMCGKEARSLRIVHVQAHHDILCHTCNGPNPWEAGLPFWAEFHADTGNLTAWIGPVEGCGSTEVSMDDEDVDDAELDFEFH